ncbi:MAG: response regulator [Rectinema sp.]
MLGSESGAEAILLVEDNPDDEELALLAFKASDVAARVIVAHDGVEALDYLFRRGSYKDRVPGKDPKLVLLDLKLPRISGLEVLKRMRAEARTRLIPVVMLTTSNEESDIFACYQSGANSYIRKPLEFDRFKDTVRQLGRYWLQYNETL